MRIQFGFFIDFDRERPDDGHREVDIAGTQSERLPEFEEGVADVEAKRPRIGFGA